VGDPAYQPQRLVPPLSVVARWCHPIATCSCELLPTAGLIDGWESWVLQTSWCNCAARCWCRPLHRGPAYSCPQSFSLVPHCITTRNRTGVCVPNSPQPHSTTKCDKGQVRLATGRKGRARISGVRERNGLSNLCGIPFGRANYQNAFICCCPLKAHCRGPGAFVCRGMFSSAASLPGRSDNYCGGGF
jgi:hypothetical protein